MKKKKIPFWLSLSIGVIVASLLLMYPLDYYIMKPGSAYNINEYLQVDDGDEDDEGTFNMMTVSMSKATPLTYVYAQFKDYYELLPLEQVRQEGEDDEEYKIRQNKLMTDSQFNALYMAFSHAGLEYEVTYKGVYVLNVIEGGAADQLIEPGDEIVEVAGEIIENQTMLAQKIAANKNNEPLEIVINREGELLTETVVPKEIPRTDGQIGLGIVFVESKSITTNPHVKVEADGIGGPSAGLMFTLEILNQLVDEDISKGYTVAGTGEMLVDGTVGRIGGIEKKVVAADEAGMDIFFAPDDVVTEEVLKKYPDYQSNYTAAANTAKKIGTTMKIVPVKTLQDALDYLEELPSKY